MRAACHFVIATLLVGCHAGSGTGTGGSTSHTTSSDAGGAGGSAAFPAPEVAGTPTTDALANAPATCGQPAFTWVKSPMLGSVTNHVPETQFTQAVLAFDVAASGVALPAGATPKYDVDTHVITYTTQDRGKTLAATAAIAWPNNAPPNTEMPILAVLHGTSGFTDGCGPSEDVSSYPLYAALASLGYIVVVPDYIGLKNGGPPTGFLHPYLLGMPVAIAVLDAVRAVGQLPAEIRTGGAVPTPNFVVVGGSEGGHAALWVDRLAPYYARELNLLGVAATVPPADLPTEATLALTTLRESSENMVVFFGADQPYYDVPGNLSDVLVSPLDTQVEPLLASGCNPANPFTGVTMLNQVFTQSLLGAASADTVPSVPTWGCIIGDNGLLTTPVARIQKDPASYGILWVNGGADQLVDTPTERAAFQTLCKAGMPMQFLECAGAGHTQTTTWALPEIVSFLADRVAGTAFTPDCTAGAPVTCAGTPDGGVAPTPDAGTADAGDGG